MTDPPTVDPARADFFAKQFHDEPGTAGWHVLYGGAQAVFATESFATGVRFAQRIAEVTADLGREPDIDLRARSVAVVTSTGPRGRIDRTDAEVARRVNEAAGELGLSADPLRLQTVQIGVAQAEGVDTTGFWSAVLGYDRVEDVLADPLRRWPRLWFYDLDKHGRGRTHIDVAVPNHLGRERADAALAAGGRLAVDEAVPHWWGLASPDNHGVDIAAWGDAYDGRELE